MNVTDGDRERAEDIACDLWNDMGNANVVDIVGEQVPVHAVIDGWAETVAAALAEEREKAVAPFLALVSEYAGEALSEHFAGHTTAGDILRDISRAAEVTA